MPSAGESRSMSTKRQAVRRELLVMMDGLDVGDALPSERRLAEELGVSRPTLRQAIDGLVADGLLDRRHGSGTYVAEPRIAVSLTMTSFTEDMLRRGMKPGAGCCRSAPSPRGRGSAGGWPCHRPKRYLPFGGSGSRTAPPWPSRPSTCRGR